MKPITWLDCFKENSDYNYSYDWENDLAKQGFKFCYLCGAIILERRDYLHVDFHNSLIGAANG
jgi:hypothetical protein